MIVCGRRKMNITVYLGANTGCRQEYIEKTKELGTWIGNNGHTLVYGGGAPGLMGILADSVLDSGGKVIGIIPEFMVLKGRKHPRLSETYVTETMSERRDKMIELGDVYIAVPGGVGTLDEISEVIAAKRLGLHHNPCIFYNVDGYYDPMKKMLKEMTEAEFLSVEDADAVLFPENLEQLAAFLKADH